MRRLLAALLALIPGLAFAQAEPKPVQIFLAHAQSQDALRDPAASVADTFRKEVARLSQGRLRVEILPDGVVGGNRDTTALVEKGVIHSALVTLGGVVPLAPPLALIQVPYAFDSLDMADRVLRGSFGQSLAEDLAARSKLRLLGFAPPGGFHVLTNNRHPVQGPDDMAGLKVRAIPGSAALQAMIGAVGGKAVKVGSREEISALAAGVVDGQMSPAAAILSRGMDGVQKYATLTNHLYVPYAWIFNAQAFASLDPADQAILDQAVHVALAQGRQVALSLKDAEYGEAGLVKRLAVHNPSPAQRKAFAERMRPPVEAAILREIGADGAQWLDRFHQALAAGR